MKLVKGSKAAREYMAKIRAKKKVSGLDKVVRKGNKTSVLYTNAAPKKAALKKVVQASLFGIGNLFDYSIINDIDSLKKQYFQLAKKYHPDSGGTTAQFQQLANEYEKAFKKLLSGSKLSSDEKNIEVEIDEVMRKIIDEIVGLETISIELIGKWIWVGSTIAGGQFTTPIYNALKAAGLLYIKKAGRPFMVYKGVESKSRGKMSIDDIRAKYGVTKFEAGKNKKIQGIGAVKKLKLTRLFKKLTSLLNKRSV